MELFQGCRWNNFTEEWNAQIVSKAVTKLRKHIQKWKNKMPFQGTFLYNCIEDAMPYLHEQLA